jgi:hypothetical protein
MEKKDLYENKEDTGEDINAREWEFIMILAYKFLFHLIIFINFILFILLYILILY